MVLSRPSLKAPLSRKALRDEVYEAISQLFFDSAFAPETPLSIDGLARDLGVSPTPVREALAQLEHTGLVTRTALKGYRVAPPISKEQLGELMEARGVIEVAAAERAALDSASILEDLRAAYASHAEIGEELAAQVDPKSEAYASTLRRYFQADWRFHVIIMRASNNRYLAQMLDGLGSHVHRFRQLADQSTNDAPIALKEHAVILKALEKGDARASGEAMRAHLDAVRTRSVEE